MEIFVSLKLFATLKKYLPESAEHFPIDAGTSVRDIVGRLGIPPEYVKLVFIDGQKQSLDTLLQGGERVGLFPPVGGG